MQFFCPSLVVSFCQRDKFELLSWPHARPPLSTVITLYINELETSVATYVRPTFNNVVNLLEAVQIVLCIPRTRLSHKHIGKVKTSTDEIPSTEKIVSRMNTNYY